MSAFAALSLLCIASSCKDQNFDWDKAHADSAQKKFTNAFIEAFGKPAEGHKWGFDMPWLLTNSPMTRANLPEDVREKIASRYDESRESIVNKADNDPSIPTIMHYGGTVSNILPRENWEVYEWFSTHKVNWTNTTSKNDNGEINLVYFDEVHSTKQTSDGIAHKVGELSNTSILHNSLLDYTPDYWLENPTIGLSINFTHAWIQNVACDPLSRASGDPAVAPNKMINDVEKTLEGTNTYGASVGMDYLSFYYYDGNNNLLSDKTVHVNDFNTGNNGWGYGNQSSQYDYNYVDDSDHSNDAKYQVDKNGVLICGVNFNNTAVRCSGVDGLMHDKWIIVYLKGEGYEGWYMGFDLEGGGSSGDNQRLAANGYCNDWIIKLTAVGGPGYEPWDARIMCEDLGGEDNTVELGGGSVMTSDIDYNDIVIDIEKTSADNKVQITLQAAGGTLPLTLWYEKDGGSEVPLFETHELFKENTHTVIAPNISHVVAGPDYRIMYNTGSGDEYEGTSVKQTITLVFDPETAQSVDVGTKTFNIDEALPEDFKDFMDKLKIKVYRHTTVDYIDNPNDNTYAVWQTLENIDGEAPLMICVPRSTKWLKERNSIKLGYGGFPTWVQHPELYFWIPPGVNEQFLYTPSSN